MQRVSLLIIGDEILDGRIADTNTQFLASELASIGYPLGFVLSCRDDVEDICGALRFLRERSPFIIASGGLGPTSDDLTRQAVASLTGKQLCLHPQAHLQIQEVYKKRGRQLDEINLRQAILPEGALVLRNTLGTAPGFACDVGKSSFFAALPGVPFELKLMFKEELVPLLEQRLGKGTVLHQALLRIYGTPESAVGKAVEGLGFSSSISICYRASFPEVQLLLQSPDAEEVRRAALAAEAAIGPDKVYSTNSDADLVKVVHDLLIEQGRSAAVAESCTGGLLGSLFTKNPGSSAYFKGGILSYSNEVKQEFLGVGQDVLLKYGAVSEQCAEQMAAGVRKALRTDFGLSITGVAGPEGGSPDKPVGVFYAGLAAPSAVHVVRRFLPLDRSRIRLYAAWTALDLLRRFLYNLRIGD